MTDEGFFTFMNRIHRFIDCFVTAYSTNIMKMKFNNEQNWKQNKNQQKGVNNVIQCIVSEIPSANV